MSIIDRARDALKRFEEADPWDSFEPYEALEALGPDCVEAVDRAAKLADELHKRGNRLGNSAYVHERAEGAGYMAAAAQLMAALKGTEE